MSEKKKIIYVAGPTASGKTGLSITLAKTLGGEIINADSMQIYKGIPIASACPTAEEKGDIPHHLFEFLSGEESFTVAQYTLLANQKIEEVLKREKMPIIVGGTGLYITSLVDNIKFSGEKADKALRSKLIKRLKESGADALYSELLMLDKPAALSIHKNDTRRIIRALELCYSGEINKTMQNNLSRLEESPYEPIMLGITYSDRELLYERINKRVDIMLEKGLLAEAKEAYLKNSGGGAVNAIGHKEFFAYFNGEISLEQAVDNLKRATRRYAKRQLTWFNRDKRIHWLYADLSNDITGDAEKYIKEALR